MLQRRCMRRQLTERKFEGRGRACRSAQGSVCEARARRLHASSRPVPLRAQDCDEAIEKGREVRADFKARTHPQPVRRFAHPPACMSRRRAGRAPTPPIPSSRVPVPRLSPAFQHRPNSQLSCLTDSDKHSPCCDTNLAFSCCRPDAQMIARAMARKGNALVKLDDLEQAIASYQKSLMEHRTADTLKRLNETEKELRERRQLAYEDPAKAEEARELGNTAFRDQKYPEAVGHYTEAIKRNPRDHRTYSNRSACYTKLTAFPEALKDAEKCIELAPAFAKGYTRKGAVQFFMKDHEKALATYQAGLAFDPDNEELKGALPARITRLRRNVLATAPVGMLRLPPLAARCGWGTLFILMYAPLHSVAQME